MFFCQLSFDVIFLRKEIELFIRGFLKVSDRDAEAAIRRCSQEKVFWKYAANLQENAHVEVWFQ